MPLTIEARPTKANRTNFPAPIPISVPAFVKEQYLIPFNGSTYSPFDTSQVEHVADKLLDFATERFLNNGYYPFLLTVLPDYPEFKLVPFDALDNAACTSYSEGFIYPSFPRLLIIIRECQQIKLDYANPRLLSLLETLYGWSCDHARQFKAPCREVFTRLMQTSPAAPDYAFIMACAELDLPLEKWLSREPAVFRDTFGSDFPVASGEIPLAEAIRQDLAALAVTSPVTLESGVA